MDPISTLILSGYHTVASLRFYHPTAHFLFITDFLWFNNSLPSVCIWGTKGKFHVCYSDEVVHALESCTFGS